MKKRMISLMVVFTVILSTTTMSVYAESYFSDVSSSNWASGYINALVDLGVVDGYSDGTFRPSNTLTVEQYVKMVVVALGEDLRDYVSGESWSLRYLEKGVEIGIIDSTTSFNGLSWNATITRERMSEIAVKAEEYRTGIDREAFEMNATIEDVIDAVSDLDNANADLTDDIAYAYGLGIICGYTDGTFRPTNSLTRAEATAVILRIVDEDYRNPFELEDSPLSMTIDEIEDDEELASKVNIDELTFNDDGTITIQRDDVNYTTNVEDGNYIKTIIENVTPLLVDNVEIVVDYFEKDNNESYIVVYVWTSAYSTNFQVIFHTDDDYVSYVDSFSSDELFEIKLVSLKGVSGVNEDYSYEREVYNSEYDITYTSTVDSRYMAIYEALISSLIDDDSEEVYNYMIDAWFDDDTQTSLSDNYSVGMTEYVGNYRVDRTYISGHVFNISVE